MKNCTRKKLYIPSLKLDDILKLDTVFLVYNTFTSTFALFSYLIKYVVATFMPRSSHISNARFTHSLLLAISLAAGRRSAPQDRAMVGLLLFVDSLLNRCYM